MRDCRRWTREEHDIIKKAFAISGAKRTQARLQRAGYERTLNAIHRKASQLGLKLGKPDGYITLKELEEFTGLGYKDTKRQAKREGVLRCFKVATPIAPVVVSESWAFTQADKLVERRDVAHSGWYTSPEVARKFRRSEGFVSSCARRVGKHSWLRARLHAVTRRKGTHHHWYWSPREIDALVKEWDDRHEARARKDERTERTPQNSSRPGVRASTHTKGQGRERVGRPQDRSTGLGRSAHD